MARQGVLELPEAGSLVDRHRQTLSLYVNQVESAFVDPPAAIAGAKAGVDWWVNYTRHHLNRGGPWNKDAWRGLSSLEANLEHAASCRKLEQLRERLPATVPTELSGLRDQIVVGMDTAAGQTRQGWAYPDRGTLGEIESQLDLLDELHRSSESAD
jgi:hypothetical protein